MEIIMIILLIIIAAGLIYNIILAKQTAKNTQPKPTTAWNSGVTPNTIPCILSCLGDELIYGTQTETDYGIQLQNISHELTAYYEKENSFKKLKEHQDILDEAIKTIPAKANSVVRDLLNDIDGMKNMPINGITPVMVDDYRERLTEVGFRL